MLDVDIDVDTFLIGAPTFTNNLWNILFRSTVDCLLKDVNQDLNLRVASDRAKQAREDIDKVMALLRRMKSKAAGKKGVASGSRAKAAVYNDRQEQTDTNLKKEHLTKNKRGKVVTKAASKAGQEKKAYRALIVIRQR